MEIVSSVLESIRKGEVMFSVDPKDAYFQISVHLDSRLFLYIAINGRVYQFKALCCGLSMAPTVFTRAFYLSLRVGSQEGNPTASLP